MQSYYGGLSKKKAGDSQLEAMRKGTIAQPIIAGRADVQNALKRDFVSVLQEKNYLATLNDDDVEIQETPGISIYPYSQDMAAAADLEVFLKKTPTISMPVEIKFSVNWDNNEYMLKLYSDQCKMQILANDGIAGVLVLVDSSLAKDVSDVQRVAFLSQFRTIIIRRDKSWEEETLTHMHFFRSLSNIIIPQLRNGQNPKFNPSAPSTFKNAVQVIDDDSGRKLRNGRSYRHDCESFFFAKYVNFEKLEGKEGNRLVRKQEGITAAEAADINAKVLATGKSGVYLVKCNPEHNGCSRPISVDTQYSPEQWTEIHEKMLNLQSLGVTHDKIALMLSKEFQLVGKTSQDVSNILKRLETVDLAERGQILLTNGDELMSALDNLPVISVSLFNLDRISDGKTIMQIIRIKAFHGCEQKIAYLEYQDWTLLQRALPHSLLMCYTDPLTASFPSTDARIEPYLYHFGTSEADVHIKKLNPTGTQVVPLVISWIDPDDMKRSSLCPETVINDSTSKVCKGNFKYNCTLAQFADGHTAFYVKSLLTEKRANFVFLFVYVLYIIYGVLMNIVTNVQIDGNDEVFEALQIAIASGKLGAPDLEPSLCCFHGLSQPYLMMYGSKLAGMRLRVHNKEGFRAALGGNAALDGGKGKQVYDWLTFLAYTAKSKEFVETSLENLYRFIAGEQIGKVQYSHPEVFTDRHKVLLLEFVNHVVAKFPRLLKCLNNQVVDMHLMTSNICEGNFRPIKKLSGLNSHSAPASLVKWTESSAEVRHQRDLKRADRDANAFCSKYASDDAITPQLANVLRVLNPHAQSIILDELRRSKDLVVYRIAYDKYLVVLGEQAISSTEKLVMTTPHLFTWRPEDNDIEVQVLADVGGVLRLRCSCFTCKRLLPCCAILAIKGGCLDYSDLHFRYFSDFLNNVYSIKRSRADLYNYRGAVFTPADEKRYKIVESPRAHQVLH